MPGCMKLPFAIACLSLAACGGGTPSAPAESPTTVATIPPPPSAPVAPPVSEPAAPPAAPPPPVPEAAAEKCDGGWVCVKISFTTRKVEKRETKLMGDPKVESTWSKTSDGRPVTFDDFSKGPVELTLRHLPNKKGEVVVKLVKGGVPIVIDKRDGTSDEFTHVGAIATEQDGALLVDLRYQR